MLLEESQPNYKHSPADVVLQRSHIVSYYLFMYVCMCVCVDIHIHVYVYVRFDLY